MTDAPIGWVQALDLIRNRPAPVLAAFCLRSHRQGPAPSVPLSLECAAGSTRRRRCCTVCWSWSSATQRACGGAAACGLAGDDPALRAGTETLAAVRRAGSGRASWIMDITSDIALPCLVAAFCNAAGGSVAYGTTARTSRAAAARAAVLELLQIELAAQLKRRALGDAALRPADLAHIRRHSELNARRCALLQPSEPAAERHNCPELDGAEPDAGRALAHAVGRPGERAIDCYAVDLTRPAFDIPVFLVICPALETEPSSLRGSRLAAAEAAAGGGSRHTQGVPLF